MNQNCIDAIRSKLKMLNCKVLKENEWCILAVVGNKVGLFRDGFDVVTIRDNVATVDLENLVRDFNIGENFAWESIIRYESASVETLVPDSVTKITNLYCRKSKEPKTFSSKASFIERCTIENRNNTSIFVLGKTVNSVILCNPNGVVKEVKVDDLAKLYGHYSSGKALLSDCINIILSVYRNKTNGYGYELKLKGRVPQYDLTYGGTVGREIVLMYLDDGLNRFKYVKYRK